MTFLDALVEKKLIGENDIASIQSELAGGAVLDEILKKRGISSADILKAKGEYYELPTRVLNTEDIPYSVLKLISEESANHYQFVPIGVTDSVLEVGVLDPDDINVRDALSFISAKIDMPYKIFLISSEDFEKVVGVYKGLSAEVTHALTDLQTDVKQESPNKPEQNESKEEGEVSDMDKEDIFKDSKHLPVSKDGKLESKIVEDAPVTKIVATIIRYATEGNASDIHIEPMRETVRVRFRVDGELSTSLVLPGKIESALVARIKILSNMRLDEKRKPQDGRFSAKIDKRKIDFRVSTFPTYYGEKVVMRILDQEKAVKKFEDMGLTKRHIDLIHKAIKKPYGLILISGPTGSGKTTTLYSMLNLIDKEKKNVLSLEDPVEYNIEGISQSQIRPEIGYTFATGLRTTLRQDPNVIMVGEIRDKETAQLAIQAALTGHLVLSTIHTNSATGIIPRLVDMGVDPYLIAPTLILGVAQRLAATLCPNAGKDVPVEGSIKLIIEKEFEDLPLEFRKEIQIPQTIKEIEPTSDCPNGTRGRSAVLEMFEIDKDVEKVILASPSDLEIYKIVRAKGMLTMKEDAMIKAFRGEIPFEEVNKL